MRYAVINSDGLVINVVEWDGVSQWSPPLGTYVIQNDYCDINDTYNQETQQLTKTIVISPDIPE